VSSPRDRGFIVVHDGDPLHYAVAYRSRTSKILYVATTTCWEDDPSPVTVFPSIEATEKAIRATNAYSKRHKLRWHETPYVIYPVFR
jgi:hypothetical protein